MNREPQNTPRFAVNRAAILAQLPGVQLAAGAKRFARGRPKLDPSRALPGYGMGKHPATPGFKPFAGHRPTDVGRRA